TVMSPLLMPACRTIHARQSGEHVSKWIPSEVSKSLCALWPLTGGMTIHPRLHVKPGVAWPMPGEVTLHTMRSPLPGHASSLPNLLPVSMLAVWMAYTSVRAAVLSPTAGNTLHDSILGCVCAVASGAGFVRITSAKDEMMEYVTLGKTGLRVSVAGLGCGGN